MGEEEGMTERPRPPELRELREVLPVAQTRTHDDWSITCLAVERYEDGFKITFRVFRAGLWPCNPMLALTVADDRGGAYRPWIGGGNGAANWVDCDWRLAHNCAPALDPRAREVRVTIAEVQLTELDETHHQLEITQRYPGLWEFTIALPQPA
jgi:hypothetical protein